MKKIILLMALLFPLNVLADDLGLQEPVWKDFAPTAFVDVQEPKVFKRLNVTAKYWYQRRLDFEAELLDCQTKESYEERFSCYEDLKSKQFRENTDYNARIEAQRNLNSAIPEMNNRTDTMIPIGNYLNNYTRMMPNELRGY